MGRFFRFGLSVILFAVSVCHGQKKDIANIEKDVQRTELEAHLTFLAADEMRGRNAGSPELNIASNYIKSIFKINGVKPAPGTDDYFQTVIQYKINPPKKASVRIGAQNFFFRENLLVLNGDSMQLDGDFIYVGYGSEEELDKYDVKGKIVLALAGARDSETLGKALTASRDKYRIALAKGAAGLVEMIVSQQTPWATLVNVLTQPVWGLRDPRHNKPHAWVRPADLSSVRFQQGEVISGNITIGDKRVFIVPGKNVVAFVEGTDPKLKNEYIIVTAHYDHVGVQKTVDSQDSIFNGARDNAIGTVALLEIGKYLAKHPSKHSVILVALTSEEKGMLGSQWYTDHPLFPLHRHILSINCDGVGYNDKSRLTSISLGRTNTDETLRKAARAFGLSVGGDPDPKENFFERSDQVTFARKGVVAIKIQTGLAQMDEEIRKYYHRQADEVSTLDFDYLTKFYRSFVYAVHLFANQTSRPSWNPGDKFEEVSKKLYSEM